MFWFVFAGWLEPLNYTDSWRADGYLYEPEYFSLEHMLMHTLVGYYETSVRPVFNARDPVNISLGLTLTQILDLVSGGKLKIS